MSGHMPGRWIAEQEPDGDEDAGYTHMAFTGSFYIENGDGTVTYIDLSKPVNARLIAAAPETAAELERARKANAGLVKALQRIVNAQPPSEAVSMDDWEVYHRLANERAMIAHAALAAHDDGETPDG